MRSTRRTSDRRRGERGVALLFVVAAVTGILLLAALCIDAGLGYLVRARLNKAVDAAALAAAKVAARGDATMNDAATAVAHANSPSSTFTINVTSAANDVVTIRAEGQEVVDTYFGRLAGVSQWHVGAAAEATRYPLDLTLVLDVSLSMQRSGSFEAMQQAADNFVDAFDETRDQVGIVAYGTAAWEAYPIQKGFKLGAKAAIDALTPKADTNIEQGLELGHIQLLSAPPRPAEGPRRVVLVLFTDGRPTAFTDTLTNVANDPDTAATYCGGDPGIMPTFYGTLSAYLVSTPFYRALSDGDANANARRILCFTMGAATYTTDLTGYPWSPKPTTLPDGSSVTSDNIMAYARTVALANANATRQDHVTIYTIGLGTPAAANPLDTPDEPLLEEIANVNRDYYPNQPAGQYLFAPDSSQLDTAFQKLVARILTRVSL